jgi:DNA-binding IscR family transcriptional regulator
MSIQQVAWVLEHEHTTSGRERLVLLAIANHDGDGGSWPSVATLAREAGCSERSAQYALRELEAAGVIEIIKRGGGTQHTRDDRRPNRYVIVHRRGATACTPSDSRGASSFATGCKTEPHGVQAVAPEPSLEPSITKGEPVEKSVVVESLSSARAALHSLPRRAS